jgi:predicted house-cleaning noncanonical NTP pyrophosphatase (MazG superfamily)
MTKTNDKLSEVLGIDNAIEIIPPNQMEIINTKNEENDINADYDLSRKTFRGIIRKGEEAIDELYELAKSSEHPRSYEVLATLMKTVADTSKDLFDLQKRKKDLAGGTEKKLDETAITIDKAVFVGTTAELLKRVKGNEDF